MEKGAVIENLTFIISNSKQNWKLRVSESRGKVYFYYAEREQVQAHEVRLKLKTESCG